MPVYNVEINNLTQIYQSIGVQELEALDIFLNQMYSVSQPNRYDKKSLCLSNTNLVSERKQHVLSHFLI